MRTKLEARIDALEKDVQHFHSTDPNLLGLADRITALEDAMDIVATQLNEQIQLNMVLRALLEELTEKRK